MSDRQLRHFCRNKNCRTKLAVPTDNEHRAFCTEGCFNQFYRRRCKVCEKELPREASAQRNCCRSAKCRADFRKFRHSYAFGKVDARSAHLTGLKNPLASVVAGPSLSDFSLWAATLPAPRPSRPPATPNWHMDRQPGALAAEWARRELARREADDVQYIVDDEEWMRTTPLDSSENYPLRTRP